MNGNRFLAEGIGTFMLVFAGCGAITVDNIYAGVMGHLGVSLVFGLVVLAMIYSVGNISTCPQVIRKRESWQEWPSEEPLRWKLSWEALLQGLP